VSVLRKSCNSKILPIEIKYSQIETRAMRHFMEKFKSDEGIILTYDREDEINFDEKKIRVIPFYKYFLTI